jgi:hypothetical protein
MNHLRAICIGVQSQTIIHIIFFLSTNGSVSNSFKTISSPILNDFLKGTIVLQQLVELINEIATKAGKKLAKLIESQLQLWIAGLPS